MKLIFTDEARTDLIMIGASIAQYNPSRSLSFVRELRERCKALLPMPYAYSVVSQDKEKATRRLVHGNYLVFYKVKNETVNIIRVLSGSMNTETLMGLGD
jgi:toxin ParE1/3/4